MSKWTDAEIAQHNEIYGTNFKQSDFDEVAKKSDEAENTRVMWQQSYDALSEKNKRAVDYHKSSWDTEKPARSYKLSPWPGNRIFPNLYSGTVEGSYFDGYGSHKNVIEVMRLLDEWKKRGYGELR